jgi:hypothetical protein
MRLGEFVLVLRSRRAARAAEGDKPEGLQPDNMEMHERARLPQVVMRNSRR